MSALPVRCRQRIQYYLDTLKIIYEMDGVEFYILQNCWTPVSTVNHVHNLLRAIMATAIQIHSFCSNSTSYKRCLQQHSYIALIKIIHKHIILSESHFFPVYCIQYIHHTTSHSTRIAHIGANCEFCWYIRANASLLSIIIQQSSASCTIYYARIFPKQTYIMISISIE